ncbi:MAG: hypothetical protein GF347_01885 [Candidatus Moranbacteria bacterium]|nr:hypothetical protein [Candidatus Moranbacteria bacterium]
MAEKGVLKKAGETYGKFRKGAKKFRKEYDKTKKKQAQPQESNPFLWLIALVLAVPSDLLDMLTIPLVVGIFLAIPLKIAVYLIILKQMGLVQGVLKRRKALIFFGTVIDPILAEVPGLEYITPITTIIVIYSWYTASQRESLRSLIKSKA